MESPATGRRIPHKSKKRVFPGSSSSMEAKLEVSSPPVNRTLKRKKMSKQNEGVISSALGGVVELDSDDGVSDSYNRKDYMDIYADDYSYEDEDTILKSHFDNVNLPSGVKASLRGYFDSIKMKNKMTSAKQDIISSTGFVQSTHPNHARPNLSSMGSPNLDTASCEHKVEDQKFKKFDIVKDHSDHHYAAQNSSMMQPLKNWAKKIQEEWRILKKDLPDMIFVRVYESRMDLLTAVIIGAEGTPYHDGLFSFDVCFPSNYPDSPPEVYYHSGGIRINPNLYHNGKVCLSLLNTWPGLSNEKWMPGASTMLQVLVSIQGLILNANPYFNEPVVADSSGSVDEEKRSLQYNKHVLILSLRTMAYTMKNPPKHFEDLVIEHFCDRAHAILMACKAYCKGVRVGGVVDKGKGKQEGCSWGFRSDVEQCMKMLAREFKQIGVKDMEESTSLTQKIRAFFGF